MHVLVNVPQNTDLIELLSFVHSRGLRYRTSEEGTEFCDCSAKGRSVGASRKRNRKEMEDETNVVYPVEASLPHLVNFDEDFTKAISETLAVGEAEIHGDNSASEPPRTSIASSIISQKKKIKSMKVTAMESRQGWVDEIVSDRSYCMAKPGQQKKGKSPKITLKKNLPMITPDNKRHCLVCNTLITATRFEYLYRHAIIHSEIPRYECTVCHEKFKQMATAKSHTSTFHPHMGLTTVDTITLEELDQLKDLTRKCFPTGVIGVCQKEPNHTKVVQVASQKSQEVEAPSNQKIRDPADIYESETLSDHDDHPLGEEAISSQISTHSGIEIHHMDESDLSMVHIDSDEPAPELSCAEQMPISSASDLTMSPVNLGAQDSVTPAL